MTWNYRIWKKYKRDNTTRKKDTQFYLDSSCGCKKNVCICGQGRPEIMEKCKFDVIG